MASTPADDWFNNIRRESLRRQLIDDRLATLPDVGQDEFAFHALYALFRPFIQKTLKPPYVINRARVEVFKRRFGITSDILDYLDRMRGYGLEPILAGGKMIDWFNNLSAEESTNDYDLWFTSTHQLQTIYDNWESFGLRGGIDKGHVFEAYDRQSHKQVQFIMTPYGDMEEVLSLFDIRACAIACDGEYVYWVKGCLQDIKSRKLVIQNITPRAVTAVRVQKYIRKGYEISSPDFGLAAISYLGSMRNDSDGSFDRHTIRDFDFLQAMDHAEDYGEMTTE